MLKADKEKKDQNTPSIRRMMGHISNVLFFYSKQQTAKKEPQGTGKNKVFDNKSSRRKQKHHKHC